MPDTGTTCARPQADPALDTWGGDTRAELAASGYFELVELCDRHWLLTPEGHPFWSVGVNAATPRGSQDQLTGDYPYGQSVDLLYDSDEAWAEATAERLRAWGFNTAGSWSDADLLGPHLAWTLNLRLSGADWESGDVVDWFDPAWEDQVLERVYTGVRPEDVNLVGYFLDNEIPWGPDWRGTDTLLQHYLALPAEAPGKAVAVDLLLAEGGGEAGLAEILGLEEADRVSLLERTTGWEALDFDQAGEPARLTTLFLEASSERYFSLTTSAIREADPHHLVLGNREVALLTRAEVWEAAARHVDVLSANNYVFLEGVDEGALAVSGGLDPRDDFAALHQLTGKPVLITEFGFRAADARLPNTWPPIYPVLDTQTDRADAFETYSLRYQAVPWVVGHHWYRWVDDPINGRFDGEDNNWGLVDVQDQPYEVLTQRMTGVHSQVHEQLLVP